jgi:hypothetical protein
LPPRKSGTTVPPPVPRTADPTVANTTALPPAASTISPAPTGSVPPMRADDFNTVTAGQAYDDKEAEKRSLLAAISPGPAAQRREAPAPEPRADGRRAGDAPSRRVPTQPPPVPGSGPRKPPTLPPPGPHAPMRPLTPPPPDISAVTVVEPAQPYPTATANPESTDPVEIAARELRTGGTPPPTRIQVGGDRPFTPAKVLPVPEIPEPGLLNAAKYSVKFTRARWQRRGAIKTLGTEIKQDTEALDQVLGALGREARNAKIEGRVFSAENSAIDAAEQRMVALGKEHGEVDARKADENSKFVDVETERNTKLGEAQRAADEASHELQTLESQRRTLRDKRKELERRQRTYLKNAEDNDRQAGSATMGDARADLRRSAEGHRKEAAALEPERQDVDRKLAALERPIGEAVARLDAARAELDAAKRSLTDAREGHTHRLAELDAEQKRKSREIGLAESEVQRRLVTLGTLVNLNRIDNAAFTELYERIDRIRGAITARTTEIEKLTAERDAFDRGTLTRGFVTIGGAIVLFIALIVIIRAAL